jgi:23S rRNA A2030 N6-methylase RlmJ
MSGPCLFRASGMFTARTPRLSRPSASRPTSWQRANRAGSAPTATTDQCLYDPAVANTYAANFGDVVKHAVLCEVVTREQPAHYLESHGGRLAYDLGGLEPGPGGVWDFLQLAPDDDDLACSVYARLVGREAGTPHRPGTYPGSIALAASLLPPGAQVVAFELVPASAADLADGLARMGRSATIEVADGLTGVCELARPGDLVLLDPFDVHARGDDLTAAEAFVVLASHGVATILWYAIYDPADSDGWISDTIASTVPGGWRARPVGETAEGGLAGCGFLTAQLSTESEEAATSMVDALARSLSTVRPGLRVE